MSVHDAAAETSPAEYHFMPCPVLKSVWDCLPPMTERAGMKSAAPTQDDESATPTSGREWPGWAPVSFGFDVTPEKYIRSRSATIHW